MCQNNPILNTPCINSAASAPTFSIGSRGAHPGGVNASFCDGSVRFLKDSVAPTVWLALFGARGGEIVSADQF